jgi:hypothetical protein
MNEMDYIITDNNLPSRVISIPKYTWKCQLMEGTYWQVEEGKQPNAFHRFMQRVCFGFKWSRIDE